MKKQVLLFIAAFLIAIPAFSQDSIKIFKDTITIKEVVITGTPVKVNKNNVPMAVSVVTRQQISESNESALLPVLSGLVPGLFVTERGITGFGVSNGAAGQITIRGIGLLWLKTILKSIREMPGYFITSVPTKFLMVFIQTTTTTG